MKQEAAISTKQLEGKTAFVTGGTSGIGLAIARRFAAEGARVVICGRDGQTASGIAGEIGPDHMGVACDVSRYADICRMAETVRDTVGHLDILVAGAGIAIYKPLADWTEEDFDLLFSVNTKGQFFTVQKLAPLMRPGGAIILIGSIAARLGQRDMALYGASKAAAPALARMISADLLDRKVRVLCLTPGPVDTPIFERGGLSPEEARAKLKDVAQRVPIGRYGEPEEVASAALFLASDQSSYMLGAEIVVDGGKSQL